MLPVSYETHKAAGDHAGELCLSPVGLALVTRIAPVSMAAMLMGVWFLIELRGQAASGLPGRDAGIRGAAVRDRGPAVPSDARPGIAVLGTISQRCCEIAPCIAAGTGRILSARPDRIPPAGAAI